MKNAILTILAIFAAITVRADYEFSTITNAETGAKVTSKIIPDGSNLVTSNELTYALAGFASTGYVHEVAHQALEALTNDFAKNFTPLAAPIITNVVEDILTPRTVDWYYDNTNQVSAAVMPNWTTSRVNIEVDQSWVDSGTSNIVGQLYASGKLRNYSIVIDSLPGNVLWTLLVVDPDIATNSSYKIYATPAMRDISDFSGGPYFGWQITSNDVPCAITVRQPDKTTIMFSRDRLNSDEAYIKIEDGEPVLYTE